jgi:hypothetical protein
MHPHELSVHAQSFRRQPRFASRPEQWKNQLRETHRVVCRRLGFFAARVRDVVFDEG